jgi:hypothetical protein
MSDRREQQWHRGRVRRDEVMSLPVLRVRHHGVHHGVIGGRDGDVLICASVGPAGEVVAVWTAPDGLGPVTSAAVSAAGACFPDPAAGRPVEARITVHAPEPAAVTRIADLALGHITVQPIPGGKFLVAGARCRWRRDGPDRNGVLYDADGQVVSEGVLGDGLGQVLAGSDGQVWIGYFDEGICGNYGRGQADTNEPVGAYGIVRFSPGLAPAWHSRSEYRARHAPPPGAPGRPAGARWAGWPASRTTRRRPPPGPAPRPGPASSPPAAAPRWTAATALRQ